jgi:hypothetical protein
MSDRPTLGFKDLTLENWTQADPVMGVFGGDDPGAGGVQPLRQDRWARRVLASDLTSAVPRHIRQLFAVARGAMLYASFDYPNMTLAAEQLYRVVDAALAARMPHLNSRLTFAERIEAAIADGIIPSRDRRRWDATRRLRNIASHPERQAIYPPGMALTSLEIATEQINGLFDRTS